VEADFHHVNLFCTLVGDTSKARKGTARGHSQVAVVRADPAWQANIAGGLSSGEGLIYAVRDNRTMIDENGDETTLDEGVTDKRLMCVEAEFASALKSPRGTATTVSAQLGRRGTPEPPHPHPPRPARRDDAHISVIGHITREELTRYLDATEVANGFANRYLWVCVRRSKLLPEGGNVPEEALRRWSRDLADALDFARRQDAIGRDPEARELWKTEYPRLTRAHPGLAGALLARGEAHTLRLSLPLRAPR